MSDSRLNYLTCYKLPVISLASSVLVQLYLLIVNSIFRLVPLCYACQLKDGFRNVKVMLIA